MQVGVIDYVLSFYKIHLYKELDSYLLLLRRDNWSNLKEWSIREHLSPILILDLWTIAQQP